LILYKVYKYADNMLRICWYFFCTNSKKNNKQINCLLKDKKITIKSNLLAL
jgi:hypothetical protein